MYEIRWDLRDHDFIRNEDKWKIPFSIRILRKWRRPEEEFVDYFRSIIVYPPLEWIDTLKNKEAEHQSVWQEWTEKCNNTPQSSPDYTKYSERCLKASVETMKYSIAVSVFYEIPNKSAMYE